MLHTFKGSEGSSDFPYKAFASLDVYILKRNDEVKVLLTKSKVFKALSWAKVSMRSDLSFQLQPILMGNLIWTRQLCKKPSALQNHLLNCDGEK